MPYLSETEHQKLLHDLIKAEQINAELLEALKDISDIRNYIHPDGAVGKVSEMYKVAQKAIAKAEGR